ncbi:MAG: hypothetical protein JWP44_219 [Mucilaginibacter sp.]|nr:hypothetical protein [Mucilaginibacter sp.]
MANLIPFDFVFDYLPSDIIVKKMFGMHYIYLGKKIIVILHKRNNQSELNGIWVATSKDYHENLKNNIPELSAFFIAGDERHGDWLLLPEHAEDFEGAAIKVCEMISHGDPAIGKLTEKPPL